MVRSRVARPAAPVTVLLTLTLTTSLYSCETESPVGEPTRETLPNGAVLARLPDLPAIDSVGAEVAEAHVDLQFGSVDGADPNLTFGAIRVQAASDGTIYVLDQQAAEVRVFDSDGRYLRTIVRRGEGPGEIGGANRIFLSGDTLLWINDTRQWTIIGVDTDGDEIRRFTKPVMSVTSTWTGVFDDRGRYWRAVSHSDNEPGFPPPMGLTSWTGRHYYKSMTCSAEPSTRSNSVNHVFRIYAYSRPDVPCGFLPLRFEPFEMIAVNPAGGFWRAHNTSYRIARTGEGGDTLVVIEAGLPEEQVTDADRSAYVDSIVEDRPELRREAEEVAALMPDVKPMLKRIFVDDEHQLWVQRVTPEDAPAFYDLFSVDGDYLGSVRLAFAAAGPLVIRHSHIYTWIEDDLDVPYVVRSPLSWGRTQLTEADLLGCYNVIASGEWGLVRSNPRSPYTQRAAEILVSDSMFYQMPSRIQLAGPPIDTMRFRGRWEITMPEEAAQRAFAHELRRTERHAPATVHHRLCGTGCGSDCLRRREVVRDGDDVRRLHRSGVVPPGPIDPDRLRLSTPGSEFRGCARFRAPFQDPRRRGRRGRESRHSNPLSRFRGTVQQGPARRQEAQIVQPCK